MTLRKLANYGNVHVNLGTAAKTPTSHYIKFPARAKMTFLHQMHPLPLYLNQIKWKEISLPSVKTELIYNNPRGPLPAPSSPIRKCPLLCPMS